LPVSLQLVWLVLGLSLELVLVLGLESELACYTLSRTKVTEVDIIPSVP